MDNQTGGNMDSIVLNGVTYIRLPESTGRAVVVVDRGWIFAGDIRRENGRIYLTRALWVFRWEKIGFNGVIETPEKADIRAMADVDIPEGSEVFCVPVGPGWGL